MSRQLIIQACALLTLVQAAWCCGKQKYSTDTSVALAITVALMVVLLVVTVWP